MKILRLVLATFSLNRAIRYQLVSRKQQNSKTRPLCHFCHVCKEIFASKCLSLPFLKIIAAGGCSRGESLPISLIRNSSDLDIASG